MLSKKDAQPWSVVHGKTGSAVGRWEQPLWHPLAPEQGRECRQPCLAAWAAGLQTGEEPSFCCLQGMVPRWVSFTFLGHLLGHLCQGSQPVLFTTIPLGGTSTPAGSRLGHQPCP